MKLALILPLLIIANPYWFGRLPIVTNGQRLFLLRELPFDRFDFPRWQSVLAITMIGLLNGMAPSMTTAHHGVPAAPLWLALSLGLVTVWIGFLASILILRLWMKRGGRWDGHGNLFNLIAAAGLVADTGSAAVTALGVPALLVLPLWFYSIWVGGNALSGAMPKASLGYSTAGILVSMIPVIALSMSIGFALALHAIAAR
ncbi:hypothetical protein [Burkholderia guangdongensis]|uniref:hypothetical protein n=1 Tax=Burkholderia guangdongensis TaxID=1792500 RepID=UPI001FE361BC|nr:hypothetical protein [Burkholderia guangdongensis]